MANKYSTGLKNALLTNGGFSFVFEVSEIRIYSGPVPATADAAIDPSSVLLATIKVDGINPINMNTATAYNGVLTKNNTEVWSGVAVADGVATFYRQVLTGGGAGNYEVETSALSTTQMRVQGTVGTSNANMNLLSTTITNTQNITLDFYTMALPAG